MRKGSESRSSMGFFGVYVLKVDKHVCSSGVFLKTLPDLIYVLL